jgi:hypothetical protein
MNDKQSPQGSISFFNSTNWVAVLSNFRNQIDPAWETLDGPQDLSQPQLSTTFLYHDDEFYRPGWLL